MPLQVHSARPPLLARCLIHTRLNFNMSDAGLCEFDETAILRL